MQHENSAVNFSPEIMEKIAGLEFRARTVVEGLLAGLHKSSAKGRNVEFLEHRGYYPGDDLRHVDWRAYARSGRLLVKQHEDETNLSAHLVIDASASMEYGAGRETGSKIKYAGLLAACLSYLFLKQGDSVGLQIAGQGANVSIEPRGARRQLYRLLSEIETVETAGSAEISSVLSSLADRMKRGSLIIIFSDLLEDPLPLMESLKHTRARGAELAVFHLLDPYELEFPFTRASKFLDPESKSSLIADPGAIRSEYLKKLKEFIENYKNLCFKMDIDYVTASTANLPETTLLEYLQRREKRKKR